MSLMLEEIRQQPEVLEAFLEAQPASLATLKSRYARIRPSLIVIVARGTSDNAALFARYLFEIAVGIPTSLAAPSIATLYNRLTMPDGALIIGISQSGESTDINSYVESAKRCGAFTVGITNNGESTLATISDECVPISAGTEASVAATKTYTAELMAIYCVARALGAPIPLDDLKALPGLVDRQLGCEASIRDLAESYRDMSHAVVVGRGLNYANGLEFALKLMETSYVVASGFSAADFAHGPIAMVDQDFPSFVFTLPGPTAEQTGKLVKRLADGGADTICIGPEEVLAGLPCVHSIALQGRFPTATGLPSDTFTPIPSIIPGQLFAAHLAECKGLNPDHPRMLSKVTRTL